MCLKTWHKSNTLLLLNCTYLCTLDWFNVLKKEEVNVNNYETFKEAKLAIFEFIESWYNNKRIHSTIGYITPNEKYNNYIANLALA